MAIEKNGSKVYQSVSDLPEINENRNGDKILVQTSTGTSLLDFRNLYITLDQCSFRSSIVALLGADGNPIINKIGADMLNVENLVTSTTNTLSEAANQLNANDIANYNSIANKHNDILNFYAKRVNDLVKTVNELSDINGKLITAINKLISHETASTITDEAPAQLTEITTEEIYDKVLYMKG